MRLGGSAAATATARIEHKDKRENLFFTGVFSNGRNYTPSQARDYGELFEAIDEEVAESGILAVAFGTGDDAAQVITDGVEADLDGGDAGSGAMERIGFDALELLAEG